MDYFSELIHNYVLMAAGISWISAQIVKTIIDLLINKELHFERLVGSGGMPSCHSATVCALAVASALEYGLGSGVFAVAAIFAIVVMYDARGVRRETGTQAVIINQIMDYFNSEHPEKIEFNTENLKELIGHTPLQVFIGALFGIAMGFAAYPLFH
ncbi:MAG: divergent PAP2 family protein [Lachnospiraceae bacterium]|nr:divergent PAP2 family protein [Lachnospiraceae bacterium]